MITIRLALAAAVAVIPTNYVDIIISKALNIEFKAFFLSCSYMFFKTKPIRSYFLFTLVSSLLLYCLNGCKKEAPKIDNQSEQMASDTVLNWISEGQNKSLSLSERRKISNKALEHATLRKNDSIKLNYFLKLLGVIRQCPFNNPFDTRRVD